MDKILGIIRHVLTGVGGALVTAGVLTATQTDTILGSVLALVGVIWSIVSKNKPV